MFCERQAWSQQFRLTVDRTLIIVDCNVRQPELLPGFTPHHHHPFRMGATHRPVKHLKHPPRQAGAGTQFSPHCRQSVIMRIQCGVPVEAGQSPPDLTLSRQETGKQ
jgi:hypothetical protein